MAVLNVQGQLLLSKGSHWVGSAGLCLAPGVMRSWSLGAFPAHLPSLGHPEDLSVPGQDVVALTSSCSGQGAAGV